MLERIKEKMHIIFIVVMIIYLSALAIKAGQTYWKERPYWAEQERQKMSSQTTQRQVGK
jgi:uncharacterized protein YxeA